MSAPVVPVGVSESGAMAIPHAVGTVGWYRYGTVPGSTTGSAVFSGHVDAADQGVGVFARIGDLGPGDVIEVTDTAGVTRPFRVVAREEWTKGRVPLDRLFDRTGRLRIVLITCGGSYDQQALSYDDNIAVTAVPAA